MFSEHGTRNRSPSHPRPPIYTSLVSARRCLATKCARVTALFRKKRPQCDGRPCTAETLRTSGEQPHLARRRALIPGQPRQDTPLDDFLQLPGERQSLSVKFIQTPVVRQGMRTLKVTPTFLGWVMYAVGLARSWSG